MVSTGPPQISSWQPVGFPHSRQGWGRRFRKPATIVSGAEGEKARVLTIRCCCQRSGPSYRGWPNAMVLPATRTWTAPQQSYLTLPGSCSSRAARPLRCAPLPRISVKSDNPAAAADEAGWTRLSAGQGEEAERKSSDKAATVRPWRSKILVGIAVITLQLPRSACRTDHDRSLTGTAAGASVSQGTLSGYRRAPGQSIRGPACAYAASTFGSTAGATG